MPDIGDTRLGIVLGSTQVPAPADDATGVSVNLAELTCLIRIEEYYDPAGPPPVGWYAGSFVDITSVANLVLTESPNINQGTLTFLIGSPQAYTGTITIPIDSTLLGSTLYTWEVSLEITHGTNTFGSVTRNYGTIQVSFTTEASVPLKPTTPSPADLATGVFLLPELSWADGGGADTYDVYFGTPGDLVQIATAQAGLSITVLSVLEYNTVYNWRVDAINDEGTTTGDVWSFTTLRFDPPFPTGITLKYEGDGGYPGDPGDGPLPAGTASGLNNMVTLKKLVVAANNKVFYES